MSIPKDLVEMEDYVFGGRNQQSFPENAVYSVPVLTKRNGRVMEASFLYDNTIDEAQTIPRPFAWALMPTDERPDFMFSWCSAADFMPEGEYPLENRVSAYLPGGAMGENLHKVYYDELLTLVDEILEFAFETHLSEQQEEVLKRYKDLFLLVCYQGLYPYYDNLAPEFFDWIGLVLIAKSDFGEIEQEKQTDLYQAVKDLAGLFEEKISTDKHKETLFDELHAELQIYKNGGYDKLTRSMERDVILVIDHIGKSLGSVTADAPTPAGYKKLLKLVRAVEQDLVDLLYRQGVDPYVVEGAAVDVNRQKVLATEPTNNPELDKTVAERLTRGWEKDGEIVRPEYIKAYIYEQNKDWE